MNNDPYLKKLKYCVFDIETTGLTPSSDIVISASFCDGESGEITQFFTDSPLLEKSTLEKTVEKLSSYDAVITYNGRRFDLPFVLYRAKVHGICEKLPLFLNIDLYLRLKKYWPAAGMMQSLRQKAVEQALGLETDRTDIIDGAECIPLYSRFLAIGDEKAKDAILLHNADDVRQLARIFDKINFLPWHRIASEDGFLAKYGDTAVLAGPAEIKKRKIVLKAKTRPGGLPASFFTDLYSLEYDSASGNVSLCIFTEEKDGTVFADLDGSGMICEEICGLAGYYDGFLVLESGGTVNNREINTLSAKIISTLFI